MTLVKNTQKRAGHVKAMSENKDVPYFSLLGREQNNSTNELQSVSH